MNISLIIRELLFRHEKLVIPGIGTFTLVHKPAEISKTTHTLIPPSRVIRFEEQQKTPDNLLILALRKKLGLSEQAAGEMIMRFVKEIDEQLKKNEAFLFEGIGRIKRNMAGILEFEASPDILNLTGAFALPELDIPVQVTTTKVVQATPDIQNPLPKNTASQPALITPATRPGKRKYWIPATLAGLTVIALVVLYATGIFDPTGGRKTENIAPKAEKKKSDRIVFGSREGGNDSLIDSVNNEIEKNTARKNALNYREETTVPENRVPSPNQVAPSVFPLNGKYVIVSGSFLEEANAEKHKRRLQTKGLTPEILPPGRKYYMVSIGAYETREEAAAAMNQIREEMGLELWVMKRK